MSVTELSPDTALGIAPPALHGGPTAALPQSTPARLSLRTNFAWALAGNTVFAACQWGMIVALAKLGSSFMVGQFSLGLAIATPVLTFSNFDLRAVQATDARRQYRFTDYLHLRILMTLAALVVIAGIAWGGRYQRQTAMVIVAVALAKAVETLSDIHYGLFQLNDRLDQTGRSMMLRGVVSIAALSAGLYFTRTVFWGCMLVALGWLGSLLLFDVRRARKMRALTEVSGEEEEADCDRARRRKRNRALVFLALPMGVVTTMASINLHMPRYFVHAGMGEHQLGIFSALAYATVALTLIGDSLGNAAIPRLSRLYAANRLAEYRALLLRLLGVGCAIGLSGLALAEAFGARILAIFYRPEYARHSHIFTLLMIGAAIHFAATMLTSGITSARCFRIQVPLYLLVAGATAWGCAIWIPVYGLAGAALGVICGAVARLFLAAVVLGYLLLAHRPLETGLGVTR